MNASHIAAFRAALGGALRYRPALTFDEWATEHIRLEDGSRFRFRPYQVQPARDLFNSRISTVALRWYSGAGKTFLMGAGFLFGLEQERLQMSIMFPNILLAEDWIKDEWMPLVDATRSTASIHRKTDLRRRKVWANGAAMFAVGANSPGLIRRLQVDLMYADEIDAISQEVSDEGDKLRQFYKRGRGRKRQFKWASSYPSVKGESKIDALVEESDDCRWMAECPDCAHVYEMHTRQIVIPDKSAPDAYLECPRCKVQIDDQTRVGMSRAAKWIDKDGNVVEPDSVPNGGIRGFSLNCMAHVGDHSEAFDSYLHEVASEMIGIKRAENPEKAERVFVNTMDAESFIPRYEAKPDGSRLWRRREEYIPKRQVPDPVLVITAGADVQKDRIECEVVGFGLNDETWGLGYWVIHGDPLQRDVWVGLDRLLNHKFRHSSGPMEIRRMAVDSGKWQEQVLAWTKPRERRGVMAVKGSSTLGRTLIGRPSKVGSHQSRQWQVGTNEAKDLIYQRLDLQKPDDGEPFPAGYMHYPATPDYDERYFQMLTAEESRMKRGMDGDFYRFFDNPNRARNEALDCRVYAIAAFRAMRVDLEKMAKKREDAAESAPEPPKKERHPLKNPAIRRRRGGWATNY